VARSLARHAEVGLIIAGRDARRAAEFCATLASSSGRSLAADCSRSEGIGAVLATQPRIVIDTAGPFHARDYALAEACARAGCHYVDLADSREHVVGIVRLDAIARANGVLVVSGASTVPAITTAIVDELAPDRRSVRAIDVGIAPGHRAPRGLATVRSILGYSGRPLVSAPGSAPLFGWGDLGRHRYPAPVGRRWLSTVDVPERTLWPNYYPALERLRVRAGLEVGALHLGLAGMAQLVRWRAIRSLEEWAPFAIWAADWCNFLGTDTGAMHVQVTLASPTGALTTSTAYWVAERGDGPEIPAMPAVVLAKRLLGLRGYRELTQRGAMPCMNLLSADELRRELAPFAIRFLGD
jgi:hypothetical protein